MRLAIPAGLALIALVTTGPPESSGFARALSLATEALDKGDLDQARTQIDAALERDSKSVQAWRLQIRWAEAAEDRDELVYAAHRTLQLASAQEAAEEELAALNARVLELDPIASDLFSLKTRTINNLEPLARNYEKTGRPHSAIRIHKEILALDPERQTSKDAIARIAAAPDPTLAANAKPKDLLAGVSEQWIAEHDAEHADWKNRAKLKRENYTTHSDAGYAVLLRSAEAMEQMNAFYRQFFRYGTAEDGRNPSPIELRIFRNREEYLEFGSGPPVEWSGGQFTGSTVECYISSSGFEGMTGTLFHEAAHQFVDLATNAAGWLNEGLASFFEGTRILSNGTVVMNLPASGRLFPLAFRMERGWMRDEMDGIDPADPSSSNPEKAPTFAIVLENKYEWGPPWYAPTWGVVYFLYNFQDPADGRFVYRDAFWEFVDKSGGRMGKSAVKNFVETVLGNPKPVTKDVTSTLSLPTTIEGLDPVWKDWIIRLRDEQNGSAPTEKPYADWGRHAVTRGDHAEAIEHFEKGLRAQPDDAALRIEFAQFLIERKEEDRAVSLLHEADRITRRGEPVDEVRLGHIEKLLKDVDLAHLAVKKVREQLEVDATDIVQRYLEEDLTLMAMDASWRMGTEFGFPALFDVFEQAVREKGRSLARWKLAYDEQSLAGWADQGGTEIFAASGPMIVGNSGDYREGDFTYQFLTLDEVTSGDFSMEADVAVQHGRVSFAGIVFGRKSGSDFHAVILYPPEPKETGYVDLASFYGRGKFDTWRHNPVADKGESSSSKAETWYSVRLDVTGRLVDVWVDGDYVATHEFGSLDALRGSFGLIVGKGTARFSNVRYLSRTARDPAALIERELKMEAFGGGGSRDGSWLGQKPPFPTVTKWLQEPRESWEEAGAVPQLLVLWSCDQNDQVEIDAWLRDLAEEFAAIGLRIVNVAAGYDSSRLKGYLEQHRFPGSMAVDRLGDSYGVGLTHGAYGVERFFLPRLILLDVDGRVEWEGDPGFSSGTWSGDESFLRRPLMDLIERRQVHKVAEWRPRWSEASSALAVGDLKTALPILRDAQKLDANAYPVVAEARKRLAILERALVGIEQTSEELSELQAEPALAVLLDWGKLLKVKTAAKSLSTAKKLSKGPRATAWRKALGLLGPLKRKAKGDKPPELEKTFAKLDELEGLFPEQLRDELAAAADDSAALLAVIESAETMPERWLASVYFGWK